MRKEEAVFIAMALVMGGLSSARGDNPVLGFIAGAIGISVVILLLRFIRRRIMR